MEHREQMFRDKFKDAATCLNAAPEQLVSLKIRDVVGDYREYHQLLRALEHEAGVRSRSVQGNFQGNGYVVEQSKTKAMIVEHETGLEILYIAGSIASLLGLIPLILRCWSVVHGDGRHRPPDFRRVETRRLGNDGHLIEERNSGLDVPWAEPLSVMNTVMIAAAETIDSEVQRLRAAVSDATKRLDAIERTVGGNAPPSTATGRKSGTTRTRKRP